MRLKMDGDHLPALGQFGQIAPEAVWVDAPVKKNERLAGAMHAVKNMLAIDVGKIRIRHGGGLLGLNEKGRSQHCGRCGSLQEIASGHIVLTARRTGQRGGDRVFSSSSLPYAGGRGVVTICLRATHPAARTVRAGLPPN